MKKETTKKGKKGGVKAVELNLVLNNEQTTELLARIFKEAALSKKCAKYADKISTFFLMAMALVVAINLVCSFVFNLGAWVSAIGTLVALILFFFHLHWWGKYKMVLGSALGEAGIAKIVLEVAVKEQLADTIEGMMKQAKDLAGSVGEKMVSKDKKGEEKK